MNDEVLLSQQDGYILRLTFNRPDRLNAVNEDMYEELIQQLIQADADDQVRCVVLSGAGRAFCVGADLKVHASGSRDSTERGRYIELGQKAAFQIQSMSTPVIASVHGYAVGAGAEMAVAADFLIVSSDARMRFPEVSIGTFVTGGVTYRLPRLIGLQRATELLMLGDWFSGADAHTWGLACRAATDEDLDAAVDELAGRLTKLAPLSIAALKRQLSYSRRLEGAMDAEASEVLSIMQSDDWREGVAAFVAKRPPSFLGK